MSERKEELKLRKTDEGLELEGIRLDFELQLRKLKMQPLSKQPLLKALGSLKDSPFVLDATAGLAKDAFLMALKGHHVTALEQNKSLFLLVQDAIARSNGKVEALKFLEHLNENSFEFLQKLKEKKFDAIYLDPMYPQRESSALPKKEMQVLRELLHVDEKTFEQTDEDTTQLLTLALEKSKKRVVLKRPLWAPKLSKPRHSQEGKLSRFDVYIVS
ncbi:MAG: class I SAM-dependent methyltransferase [Bdellovibrionales bacterium]